MGNFKRHTAAKGEWSETHPVMRGYKLACCDCGLVHDMEFDVLRVTKTYPDGSYDAVKLKPEKYRVKIRMRRNNRSTGQIRRQDKRRKQQENL